MPPKRSYLLDDGKIQCKATGVQDDDWRHHPSPGLVRARIGRGDQGGLELFDFNLQSGPGHSPHRFLPSSVSFLVGVGGHVIRIHCAKQVDMPGGRRCGCACGGGWHRERDQFISNVRHEPDERSVSAHRQVRRGARAPAPVPGLPAWSTVRALCLTEGPLRQPGAHQTAEIRRRMPAPPLYTPIAPCRG